MQYQEILSRFTVVRRNNKTAVCFCPVHQDNQPSLAITDGNDRALIYCHAGCQTQNVAAAVGLRMSDLYYDDRPPDRKQKYTKQQRFQYFLEHYNEARYDYQNYETGEVTHVKFRYRDKQTNAKRFSQGHYVNGEYIDNLNGVDTSKSVYCHGQLDKVKQGISDGKMIIIPEGEKDVDCLVKYGYIAITSGGATSWKNTLAPLFKGAHVIVCRDNDQRGADYANDILRDIKNIAASVRVILPTPDIPHGDISDYFAAGHTRADFEKLLQEPETAVITQVTEPTKENKLDLLQFCRLSQKGFPVDVVDNEIEEHIVAHYRIMVLFGKPYLYTNGVFRFDEDGVLTMDVIKKLILPDLRNDNRISRIYKYLIKDRRLQVKLEDINNHEDFINFKNGMLNIRTMELCKHDPKYRSIFQVPHSYVPGLDFEKSVFNEFLKSRIPNKDNLEMLLESYGHCLLPKIVFQKMLLLLGTGNAGKSIILQVLIHIVGESNIAAIPLANLKDRFTTCELLNKPLNTCGDLDVTQPLDDLSIVKQATGEDTIKGEYKGGRSFFFKNQSRFVFSANEMPPITGERSNGFFRRLLVVRFFWKVTTFQT